MNDTGCPDWIQVKRIIEEQGTSSAVDWLIDVLGYPEDLALSCIEKILALL